MGRSLRFRRVVAASAVLLGVGALAACTPKPAAPPPPAPPAPTTTTLPAPKAHLTISPTTTTLSTEATFDNSQTQTFFVKNDGAATSGPIAIDLTGLANEVINWRIPFDLCSGNTLAVGDQCAFNLEPHVAEYWPGSSGPANFVVTGGPGVSVEATASGTLTSDLQIPASKVPLIIQSPVSPGNASADFEVQNVSNTDIGPLFYTLNPNSGPGTWAIVAPSSGTACVAGQKLLAHTTCKLGLQYSNNTGAGLSSVVVVIDGDDGSHAGGAAFGLGTP